MSDDSMHWNGMPYGDGLLPGDESESGTPLQDATHTGGPVQLAYTGGGGEGAGRNALETAFIRVRGHIKRMLNPEEFSTLGMDPEYEFEPITVRIRANDIQSYSEWIDDEGPGCTALQTASGEDFILSTPAGEIDQLLESLGAVLA